MQEIEFKNLNLKEGALIDIHKLNGVTLSGEFQGNYNNSSESFLFSNYSNGNVEWINLNDLHSIVKYNF